MRFRHKFNSIRTELDGITFHSKREAEYYKTLQLKVKAGEIIFFLRQTPIHLTGGVKYYADFVTFNSDGTVHFIDVKGFKTPTYAIKKKQVEALYPIEIEEV